MSRSGSSPETPAPSCVAVVVPAGLPGWITAELIEQTLRVWQRFYEARLTVDDAVGILLDTGRLLETLSSSRSRS